MVTNCHPLLESACDPLMHTIPCSRKVVGGTSQRLRTGISQEPKSYAETERANNNTCLVQRDQRTDQHDLVLVLDGYTEAVDNAAKGAKN